MIHARLGAAWPEVLAQLGIGETFLRPRKQGPCPACGGVDRYTFDNRTGRGDFYCRHCGAGDGFTLLQRVHGWRFRETCRRVAEAAGLAQPLASQSRSCQWQPPAQSARAPARPTRRVLDVLRGACLPEDVAEVREDLGSRRLWPLPAGCTLRAHALLEYWEQCSRIGRYAALVADVCDVEGERVTTHVTYLEGGRKLEAHAPRKILSPLTGRTGCAVRLLPLTGDTLGVAEGLETALSASALHEGLPTWAALNTALLAKFEPPPGVRTLIVFPDLDVPGLEAAAKLMERLQGRVTLELRTPPAPADWNDVHRGAA
jgi:putative DNA primase/helicase